MIKTNKPLKRLIRSEKGYASFVVTLVTLIVVSLIVIAFATDARIEQKNSLANDLANQAYYAAESGITDAYNIVAAEVDSGATTIPSTNGQCASGSSIYNVDNGTLYSAGETSGQISYDCLIVNPIPTSLNYQDIEPGDGQTIELTTANTADQSDDISTITVSWESYGNPNPTFNQCPSYNGASAGALPPEGTSYVCGAGVLQLDIVNGDNLDNILNNVNSAGSYTDTVFLAPEQNSSLTQTSPLSAHNITPDGVYPVYCSSSDPAGQYACTESLSLSSLGSNNTYYLHLQDFYTDNTVSIIPYNAKGVQLDLSDAQIVIDSTGDANGQLKRLVERVCYGSYCNNLAPNGAIQSTECINKKFEVYPGDTSLDDISPPANC